MDISGKFGSKTEDSSFVAHKVASSAPLNGDLIALKSLGLLIAASILSSCGMNAVRVQTASDVGNLSQALAGSAKAQLSRASDSRERAFISFIASDPSCSYGYPIYIFVPKRLGLPPAPRCANGSQDKRTNYSTEEIDFSPLSTETLAPTLDLIGAVSAYGEALSKIADQPDVDVSDEISEAIGLAARAQVVAQALGASGGPDVKKMTNEQVQAATDVINMLANLAQEKRKVADIRALVTRDSEVFKESCKKLKNQIQSWNSVVSVQSAVINRGALQNYYQENRKNLSFELRERMLYLILESDKEPGRIKAVNTAFAGAVDELSKAHGDLESALNNPTKEQRNAAAKITRSRFVSAFKLAIDALLEWKVI